MTAIHDDAVAMHHEFSDDREDLEDGTHSLPVQNELASLASQANAPRSSSGRPILPKGLAPSYFLFNSWSSSRKCVNLRADPSHRQRPIALCTDYRRTSS